MIPLGNVAMRASVKSNGPVVAAIPCTVSAAALVHVRQERPERRDVRVHVVRIVGEVVAVVVLGPRPHERLQRRHRHLQHAVSRGHGSHSGRRTA